MYKDDVRKDKQDKTCTLICTHINDNYNSITRAMGFKTARRKCEGENSTANRMNSTVLYRKMC